MFAFLRTVSLWYVIFKNDRDFSKLPAIFRLFSDYFISYILSIIMESILNALYILMKIFGQTGRIFSLNRDLHRALFSFENFTLFFCCTRIGR